MLLAQVSSDTEIQQLRSLVLNQQKTLEQQQSEIQALQAAIAEQNKRIANVPVDAGAAKLIPAVDRSGAPAASPGPQAPNQPQPGAAQQGAASEPPEAPTVQEQEEVQDELQRGPEIADVTPDTPALEIGPARIRLIGYPALTGLWRSSNNGGNVGSSFGSIPFDNTVAGTTSEFRLSTQSTRLAIRADADLATSYAAGYFEMDFGGSPNPGNVAVSSSSYSFRVRQAFLDWGKGKWELTAGQLFTLMTPLKEDILPWPGDVGTTQVIDTNYVPGLVWGRYPQVRAVYHLSKATAFAISAENPEQQVGNNVVFPTALSSTLNNQYNTGSNELKVPNVAPDLVVKGAFNGRLSGDRKVHLDVGGLMRTFRSWNGGNVYGKDHAFGWGANANFTLDLVKSVRLVIDGFASAGGGRYIGGLAPDVVVTQSGNILPIHSYSWVGGFELAPNKATGLYFYYSALYAQRNSVLNSDGTCCVGFGFPGANNVADRLIGQLTAGYSRVLWKYENVGSVQWGVQYAYQWLQPWVAGSGPSFAKQNMVFSQLRYNLP